MGIDTKICTVCKKEKFVYEFHQNNYNQDGLTSHCKKCRSTERVKKKNKAIKDQWAS